jgi:hypothetical protein
VDKRTHHDRIRRSVFCSERPSHKKEIELNELDPNSSAGGERDAGGFA